MRSPVKNKRGEITPPLRDLSCGPMEQKAHVPMIKRVKSAKLLGMARPDNLKRREHINGKGGVISALIKRLFLIRRLKNAPTKVS